MYTAEETGKQAYAFHTAETTARAMWQMAMDQDLRRALAQGHFLLHYQPQVSLATGQVLGVEALLRRVQPDGSLVTAQNMIPVAERSGLIRHIGEWVMREACAQACTWRDQGIGPLRVGVNVSAKQLPGTQLIRLVTDLLRASDLPPNCLEIEITESTLQSEYGALVALSRLKRLGVTLAIDDFGTGYSSLSSLRTLPIHRIKIDKAFVRDLPDDADDSAIVEAVVAMAHRLGLAVVAEGVETAAQEAFLRQAGCEEAQGFFYAQPMAPDELVAWLRARPQALAR